MASRSTARAVSNGAPLERTLPVGSVHFISLRGLKKMSQTQDKNALFTDAAAAPATPVITTIVDATGPLAGYIPPTGLASDAQPTVLGTGVAGDIINLFDNNVLLGTALVNATGRWSFQPQTPLSSGKHELTATQSSGGQTSAVAESYPFSVAQIMVTGVTASDGTAIANGGTAHGPVTVTGWIADASIDSSHIALYVSGGNMGTGTVLFSHITVSGNTFSAVISQDSAVNAIFSTSMADGTYHIDAAANTSSGKILTVSDPRMGLNVTEIWTPVPLAPTILGLAEHTLNGLHDLGNGDTSHDASPTFALVTVPGDTYSLYDNGTLVATVVATSSQMGWTVPALSNGVHNLSITHTNAGGTSAPNSVTVTVDATPPGVPVITTIHDATGPLAGYIPPTGLASDAQPTIMGTGHAGDTINVFDHTTLLGTALVDSTGRWNFTPQTPLTGGAHELFATQSDGVHTSAVSESYPFSLAQIMVTGVTASDGTAIANGGTAHGPITVTGWIADASIDSSHIALYVSGGNMGTGTVLFSHITVSGNTFSAVISQDSAVNAIFSTSMADGTYHIDAAANTSSGKILTVSDPRMGLNVTEIWTPVPLAPTILGLAEHTLNGLHDLGNGDTSHDASPTFALVTVPGDTYSLYDNGTLVATVVATSSQIGWTVPALSNGVHNLSITHSNADGESAPQSVTFTVDATPPGVPVITTIL